MNELMLHLGPWFIILLAMALFLLPQMARILREYERGVIFRWGKLKGARGPGLIFLIPFIDRMVRMDLRVITIDVPRQEVMTRDNVPATVDAVLYFRVVDPQAAVVKVENFLKASSMIAQTTLRSVLGLTTSCADAAPGAPSAALLGCTRALTPGDSPLPLLLLYCWRSDPSSGSERSEPPRSRSDRTLLVRLARRPSVPSSWSRLRVGVLRSSINPSLRSFCGTGGRGTRAAQRGRVVRTARMCVACAPTSARIMLSCGLNTQSAVRSA